MERYENSDNKIQTIWNQNKINENVLNGVAIPTVSRMIIRSKKNFRFQLLDVAQVSFDQQDLDTL